MKSEMLKYKKNGELPAKAGVYILLNDKNGKVYIGCSMDLRARIATHRSLLLSGKHHSQELQKAFNKDHLSVKVLAILPHANQFLLKEAELLFIQASPHIFPSGLINKRLLNYADYKG
ncbi:GIY-YIG nuclease family protein [Priestia megaterium]|uniref:GIY-YIG nuclease family protein n=1 Tax=Priestia megaterium TaxID=1404 RepID=UPI00209EA79D|nr:GIY-YIG nuclease family protein [Priestia megaterium]MCP1450344.1 group I intron endonuclease [Priestia megaterium]